MQFATLSVLLAIASSVTAKTVFVTQKFTVYADGQSQSTATANVQTVTISGANNNGSPTTLVTKTASYVTEETQAAAAPTEVVAKAAQVATTSTSSTPVQTTTSTPVQTTTSTPVQTTPATTTSTSSEPTSTSSDGGIYAEISLSDVDATFAKNILDAHNKDRALHSASDLSWSTDVYNYAKAYADKYDCSGNLVHSGGQYGENLAYGTGSMSGSAAVQMWYDEGQTYDYSSADTYNHFTQVIWKSTTKVGCAQNTCGGKGTYIICSYDPAGNFIGESKANVLSS